MKRDVVRGLGAVGLVLALVGGFRVVRTLAFFRVRRVELAGARYLTAAGVARALAIAPGRSIFDGTDSLRKRARGMLGVVEARVTRRLPGTIRVTVREAEPVALAPRGGRLVLVDAGGRVLPFDPTRPAADLPLAEADSALAGLLARGREGRPALYRGVERGGRGRAAGRILFRSGASGEEIRDVSLVADPLARQGRRWRELDARFLPHVVIRGARAWAGE